MVAIFEASPMPSHRMSSGRSAIFGIGNSAETIGKPAARASENRPTASPTEMPIAVPTTKPAPIRISDFPLGGKRAFANQRPQSGVRRAELRLEGGRAALAARNRDREGVLDLSRAPREHDDPVGELQGLVEVVGDVDHGELGAVDQ